jgi:hypothetical protein
VLYRDQYAQMQNSLFFFILSKYQFNNVILSVFKTGACRQKPSVILVFCFAIASQKDAAAIPHAKTNRRLICKYRLKVLIEIEQKYLRF